MNNFENNQNKENQWNNIEKKNTNWFKEEWESIKNFLEWKKHADKIKVKEEISRNAENLKDSVIDSTLDNLNLDMQEWLELQDSDDKTKEELNKFFEIWKQELKNDIEQPWEAELRERLFNSERFGKRSPDIVREVAKSATKIENEIKNWKQEENSVARSLLKIVNWIMWTEKDNS